MKEEKKPYKTQQQKQQHHPTIHLEDAVLSHIV